MEDKSGNENNNILGMKTCACFPKNALLKILVSYEAKNVQMSSSSFFETWVFTTPVFRTLDDDVDDEGDDDDDDDEDDDDDDHW